ncbi:MAG TPA: hypothetical protein VJ577_17560 [Burkholderiaceae bacterium]|nr:hypothetical protein [Burkholderiaceae bacterium]
MAASIAAFVICATFETGMRDVAVSIAILLNFEVVFVAACSSFVAVFVVTTPHPDKYDLTKKWRFMNFHAYPESIKRMYEISRFDANDMEARR